MRVFVLLGLAALALALPYSSPAADPPAQPRPTEVPAPAAPTTTASTPSNIRTITIDPTAPQPVCRRVVPTGSRIAERRCETPQTTAQAEANRAVLRRDFEAMRDQQMMREQARQAAMAEALRRRGAQ
jgi:hypothetical protein